MTELSRLSPLDLHSLAYAEHFTVWATRTAIACPQSCRVLHREFRHAFGNKVDQGCHAFSQLLLILSTGKRTLTIGRPGHIDLTHDEQSMVHLLSAAQHEDRTLFDAHARWIMANSQTEALYAACRKFGACLSQRGHTFPDRRLSNVAVPEASELPALRLA